MFKLIICTFSLLLCLGSQALAYSTTANKATLILVNGFGNESTLRDQLCSATKMVVKNWQRLNFTSEPICYYENFGIEKQPNLRTNYGTLITLTNDVKLAEVKLLIRNLDPTDATDVRDIRLGIQKGPQVFTSLISILKNYGNFDLNKEAIDFDLKKQMITAQADRQDLQIGDAEVPKVYQQLTQTEPNARRYLAAIKMLLAFQEVGTLRYYQKAGVANPNSIDWDYHSFGQSMSATLDGRRLRFDDNRFVTNEGHYFAGTARHILARESGLTFMQSFFAGAVGNIAWETLSEYREVVSYNDLINTSFGGAALGESFHWLSRSFQARKNQGIGHGILAGIFKGPQEFSQWVENKARGTNVRYSDLNLSPDEENFWSKIDMFAQIESRNGKTLKGAGIDNEVINLPYFNLPGEGSKIVLDDTVYSRLKIEMDRGTDISVFKLVSEVGLAAYYKKHMHLDENQQMSGYQLFIAPTMGLEINRTIVNGNERDPNSDFMGLVDIGGPRMEVHAYSHGTEVTAVIQVFPTFAMIKSLAFDSATGNRYVPPVNSPELSGNCDGHQSVLCNEGYGYAFGVNQEAGIVVKHNQFSIAADWQHFDLALLNGSSRYKESVTVNEHDHETSTKVDVVAAWEIHPAFRIEFGFERENRTSRLLGTSLKRSNLTKFARIVYQY